MVINVSGLGTNGTRGFTGSGDGHGCIGSGGARNCGS